MEIYAAAYRISCNNRSRVIDTVNGRRGSDLSPAIVMLNALFLQLSAALFIKKLIVANIKANVLSMEFRNCKPNVKRHLCFNPTMVLYVLFLLCTLVGELRK